VAHVEDAVVVTHVQGIDIEVGATVTYHSQNVACVEAAVGAYRANDQDCCVTAARYVVAAVRPQPSRRRPMLAC
jgi:hypothetical protein